MNEFGTQKMFGTNFVFWSLEFEGELGSTVDRMFFDVGYVAFVKNHFQLLGWVWVYLRTIYHFPHIAQ
jgi:hypothetical protein